MAFIDVVKYCDDLSKQYERSIKMLEAVDKDYKNGNISEEQLKSIENSYNKIKENYSRVAYIMYLLNLPKSRRKKKKEMAKKPIIKEVFNMLGADDTAILKENEQVMDDIKSQLDNEVDDDDIKWFKT